MTLSSISPIAELPRTDAGSDDELVGLILEGRSELYAVLMRRYNQRLFRITRGIVGLDDEAEDVVQHAYVAAFHQLASFRGEASFATWLTRIAVNEALGRIRQRKRGALFVANARASGDGDGCGGGGSGGGGGGGAPPSPEESAYRHELAAVLEEQIDHLPENLRAAFVMRDVEELTSREAADLLGISEAALRVRVHRARHLLQERLSSVMEVAPDAFRFAGTRCDRIVHGVMRRLAIA